MKCSDLTEKTKGSKIKMDFTGNTEDLRTVYELCEPNHEGLISLRKLQELFQSHSSSVSLITSYFTTYFNCYFMYKVGRETINKIPIKNLQITTLTTH